MPGVRAFRDPLAAPKNKGLTNSARGSSAREEACRPREIDSNIGRDSNRPVPRCRRAMFGPVRRGCACSIERIRPMPRYHIAMTNAKDFDETERLAAEGLGPR